MKSTFDILSALFKIVNAIANIGVKVLIGDAELGDQSECITLNSLANPNKYLQVGFINLNINVPEIKAGRPDLKRIKEIVDLVMPVVEDVTGSGVSFQIDDDKGIFKDQNRDSMYFYNLRLTFQTL